MKRIWRLGPGLLLLALGLGLALWGFGTLGYGQASEWWFYATQPTPLALLDPDAPAAPSGPWALPPDSSAVESPPNRLAPPTPAGAGQNPLLIAPSPTGEVPVEASPPPATPVPASPTPRPPGTTNPSVVLQIPTVQINSAVVEVGVRNGLYQVPAFVVGHHADSAKPGEPGNAVFTGHVTSPTEGHVFSRLKDLKPGDRIVTRSGTGARFWVVREVKLYSRLDRSFLSPTPEPTVTLYTCAGQWDWGLQDYTHRLVVIATPDTIPGYDN